MRGNGGGGEKVRREGGGEEVGVRSDEGKG